MQKVLSISDALVSTGTIEGSRVAVFQEPTINWVCSLVAILRIGAVYIPLDLRNPLERLAAIVEAAKPSAILVHSATASNVQGLQCNEAKVINVQSLIRDISFEGTTLMPNKARPESAAVILFTSGTTGTPKGIVLRHSSLSKRDGRLYQEI
jgi:hybrid polyketide synthase/nonribosomal peptide synthetase ACE1